jgi:hypothetical protein
LLNLERRLDARVAKIVNDCAFKIKQRVDSQEFIHWRTRRKPIVVAKARLVGELMTATVRGASGWKWGHVLVGPAGQTTIKAKKGFLAVPTDFARLGGGRGQPGPRSYSGTQIFAGIIWGKAGWGGAKTGGGLRQHRAAGEKLGKESLIPLFILKGSVVMRRRVIPAEQSRWIAPQFKAALINGGLLKVD